MLHTQTVQYEHGYSVSVFAEPDPRVQGWIVGGYQGWIEETSRPMRRREVPTAVIPLILNWGQPFGIIDPGDPPGVVQVCSSFAAGLSDRYVTVESSGSSGCIQVNLTPIGAHLLLGVSMGELTNRTIELDEILGPQANELVERLHGAPDWETRFRAVDAALSVRLANARPPCEGVAWAWRRLVETQGRAPVGDVGRELGWSRKRLIARFREQIGLAPKTVARVLRFHHVVRVLQNVDTVRWAEVAQRAGYYDQAHFIRDFGEFAGCTPGEFLGKRLPDGGVSGA